MNKLTNHKNLAALAVTLTAMAFSPVTQALTIPPNDERVDWSPWHAGSGGEFSVQPGSAWSWVINNYASSTSNQDPNNNPSFQTFCVQLYVDYSPGDTMRASFGNSRQPDGTALSQGVAWLYNQFAHGTLAGYDYANTDNSGTGGFASRTDSAADLQNAIWFLFGDIGNPNNFYSNLAINHFGSVAAAEQANTSIPVKVIISQYDPTQGGWGDANTQGGYRQNFLVAVPDAGSTLCLAALALGALFVVNRRNFSVQQS